MKSYFTLLVIAVTLLSCKKSADVPANWLKANVNGQWVTYNDAKFSASPDQSNPSQTNLTISAGDQLNSINITVQSNAEIAAGNTFTTDGSSDYQMQINLYQDDGTRKTYGTTGPGTSENPYYVVNIKSVTDNEITGNIVGNYLYSPEYDLSANLTVGEFVARRINQ
jgi:hypothetical protein